MRDPNFSRVERILYDYRTYDQAIKNLNEGLRCCVDGSITLAIQTKIEEKKRNKSNIQEIIPLFTRDELIIWEERYLRGLDVDVIYDNHCWSRSTYHRIRKRLVVKVMKCLGYL